MVFSSIIFLWVLLPCILLLYYVSPKPFKNGILTVFSLFFYAWGEPRYVVLMIFSVLLNYGFGRLVEKFGKKRWLLALCVTLNLLILGYFKYYNFLAEVLNPLLRGFDIALPAIQVTLPIGISFYTFQALSYVVDVYRGTIQAQKNIFHLALYISFFPQLIAGPIVRYSDVAAQLESRTHTMDKTALGVRRFAIGLSKKILIANVLGELVSAFKSSDEKSVLFAWMYAIAYTLHIYFDFSGYSDMAIGLGKIFGFDFLENFNYPYISSSITEFWRRWHMSLGSWFRDYLYIPLGGNRVPKWRWLLNLFIVWMATGFWHGAEWNFIVWGLMYAVLLISEKLWLKGMPKAIGHIYTLLFVILGFVIFDASSLSDGIGNIGSLFGAGGLPAVTDETLYYLRSYGVILIIAAVGATPLPSKIVERIRKATVGDKAMVVLEPVALVVMLAVCTAFLVDGSFNPFLYFRF